MTKHYCEICNQELEVLRRAHEQDGTAYWQVGLRREKSDRNPRAGVRYEEVCCTCIAKLREFIKSLGGQAEAKV